MGTTVHHEFIPNGTVVNKNGMEWMLSNWQEIGCLKCPEICNKKDGWSHILKSEEIRIWREKLVDKRFTNTDPKTGIRRMVMNKNNDKLQETGIYLSKYKQKRKGL